MSGLLEDANAVVEMHYASVESRKPFERDGGFKYRKHEFLFNSYVKGTSSLAKQDLEQTPVWNMRGLLKPTHLKNRSSSLQVSLRR
ncbi:hypothetical protein HNY73_017918 [Argiope bruennichi]|uniref:Uncharacterized protein n=1 Tax=Argiope bruennichi TaxID=94029 RepID=A0A8T0EG51_ARGBR|nr:hypothetical protein HNY73_017918 [Argiope bruennichi]